MTSSAGIGRGVIVALLMLIAVELALQVREQPGSAVGARVRAHSCRSSTSERALAIHASNRLFVRSSYSSRTATSTAGGNSLSRTPSCEYRRACNTHRLWMLGGSVGIVSACVTRSESHIML